MSRRKDMGLLKLSRFYSLKELGEYLLLPLELDSKSYGLRSAMMTLYFLAGISQVARKKFRSSKSSMLLIFLRAMVQQLTKNGRKDSWLDLREKWRKTI